MAKKAKRKIKRRSWSENDIRKLKSLARKKVSATQIAKQFKRTIAALRQKAMALGVSLDSRSRRRKNTSRR